MTAVCDLRCIPIRISCPLYKMIDTGPSVFNIVHHNGRPFPIFVLLRCSKLAHFTLLPPWFNSALHSPLLSMIPRSHPSSPSLPCSRHMSLISTSTSVQWLPNTRKKLCPSARRMPIAPGLAWMHGTPNGRWMCEEDPNPAMSCFPSTTTLRRCLWRHRVLHPNPRKCSLPLHSHLRHCQ
ncbi:hypothetical protein CYLTODRAFT_489180 [Cylindrobasidium torrendii FP15055 ss-10]|uniref:Uncharacterized protein n=1 Tax=Cylindrobasidium torrendii FP15055 ss-10 TaxID=1314674 RepID=A0A0D7BF64_9AGAR|nr:hypothetical protein CYLTODRAFT_489180 [Cylindrobasidium torrendii FP15055 ss-10]